MAAILTIDGLGFAVESVGWWRREAERDQAVNALETELRFLDGDALADLHAALVKARDDGTADYPDAALSMCADAVQSVTAGWYDPNAATLTLSAA